MSEDRSTRWSVGALLGATLCSGVASLAMLTALGKFVFDTTRSELDLGLLGLAEFAPAALLVLVTGAVADRFERRRVASAALVAEAVATAALGLHVLSRPSGVGGVFALVVCFGAARAFAAPATRALPADIVAPERLPWLIPRYSGTFQIAMIVGPVAGGFLYLVDPAAPMLAAAGLQLVAAGAVLTVRAWQDPDEAVVALPIPAATAPVGAEVAETATPARPGWRDALEGLRLIRGQPVLLGAISLDLFAVLFGGAVALLPAIAETRLGVDAVGLGWLRAAGGIGAAATTGLLALRPVQRRVGTTLLGVVALFGLATIVLGLTTSFVVALGAMLVLSGADAVSMFIRATLVPLVTPRSARGRVLAVENIFIGASNQAGDFESGVAGAVFGASGAIVLGGIGTLVVASTWWFLFPALRRIDRFPTGPEPPRPRKQRGVSARPAP